jgi:hypothetical protein
LLEKFGLHSRATIARGHAKPLSTYQTFFRAVLLSENVAVPPFCVM